MNNLSIRRMFACSALAALMILTSAATSADAAGALHRIGAVTWQPKRYIGQELELMGFPLARHSDYVLFSDEAHGRISAHDLPVVGSGIAGLELHRRYRIRGNFVRGGLKASNGSQYHLELTAPPYLTDR
ncbi:hypothetical protein FJ970_19460 [Mesorhizobium sp. B2-1-8]|uniref:hypothetical protein n=1 Tax=unclassified Mesorhizobium TaxID=325217 RepID=UPI001129EDE6|nr:MULTISPECIES: hypothetical protein [unclassified Mesorhizobium]MBZ9708638.1 hypothetical protein [Mesorhizobium sp. ESP7-2]UCI17297.1 hypothetical protein FJ970_19460 [Mesorhizobium sp. B2-1-8]